MSEKLDHLVLIGAGNSHLHRMGQFAQQTEHKGRITLIAPSKDVFSDRMLAGFIKSRYSLRECTVPLEKIIQKAGIEWLTSDVVAVDETTRCITLADGSQISYDRLSVDLQPQQNRAEIEADIPGSDQQGLFVYPCASFAALWPKVQEMGQQRAIRLAVIGSDVLAVEIACAIRQCLPGAALTLISGRNGLAGHIDARLIPQVVEALKKFRITLLNDDVLSISQGALRLGCGADLSCDVPVIAFTMDAPGWAKSAAGSVSGHHSQGNSRLMRPNQIIVCSGKRSFACWHGTTGAGRWVWFLRNWLDRHFMKQFSSFR